MIRKITIQIVNDNSLNQPNMIKIPKQLYHKWKLKEEELIQLSIGNHAIFTRCKTSNEKHIIQISKQIAEELFIPTNQLRIHCLFDPLEKKITLGPVIACVTSVNFDKEHLFHHLTDFFHEFAQYAERKSIFFTVKSLKKIDNFNTGYYYCDGKWLEDILPEPNAIYNRVAVRALEKTEAYDNFVNELNEKQIPYFNHRFLNKLEIHELLVKDERLQASIPDTVKLEEYDSFIAKLNEHGTIYVKPINGSKGRGILRIEKSVDCFIVYYSSFSNCETTTFRSSYVLYKRLIERINHLPYLIQQRIRLIKIDNRAIDFRVLCIKSVKGDWKVVSSVARVSPKENMVSNIAQGGLQIKTFELLKDLYEQQQAREFLTQIHKFALCVADSLCSNPSLGHFGELGVDIGLDEDGKLWLIEVNSKPSKIDDQRKDLTRPSTKALIAYLSSIGGFSIK